MASKGDLELNPEGSGSRNIGVLEQFDRHSLNDFLIVGQILGVQGEDHTAEFDTGSGVQGRIGRIVERSIIGIVAAVRWADPVIIAADERAAALRESPTIFAARRSGP